MSIRVRVSRASIVSARAHDEPTVPSSSSSVYRFKFGKSGARNRRRPGARVDSAGVLADEVVRSGFDSAEMRSSMFLKAAGDEDDRKSGRVALGRT